MAGSELISLAKVAGWDRGPIRVYLAASPSSENGQGRGWGAREGERYRRSIYLIRDAPAADPFPQPTLIISRYPEEERSGVIEFAITFLLPTFPFHS